MKRYIFIITWLLGILLSSTSKGQTPQQNMARYWHYRWRLTHYFMAVGSKTGMSIPADVRNGYYDSRPTSDMYWVDGGRLLGWYLMMLGTEYRILKDNGQNTDETVEELYYALHAAFRLDSNYTANYTGSYNGPFNGPTVVFPGQGVMPMDDVNYPGSYYNSNNFSATSPLNSGLYTSSGKLSSAGGYSTLSYMSQNYPVAEWGDGKVGPVTDAHGEGLPVKVASEDNYLALLMGLETVVVLDPDLPMGFPGCSNPFGYNKTPYVMAKELGYYIINYIANVSNWDLVEPDMATHDSYSGFSTFADPVCTIAPLFGISVSPPTFSLQPWTAYSVLTCGCGIQNFEMGVECAAMSNSGAAYLSPCEAITAFGNNSTAGPDGICDATEGCYPQGTYLTAGTGWDVFYSALNKVLFRNFSFCPLDLCSLENIINTAPDDGPFCHIGTYYSTDPDGDGDDNCLTEPVTDFAPNGWGTSRRFMGSYFGDFTGNWGEAGNYSGMDYMVLFNLYYILAEREEQDNTIIVNNGSNANYTVDYLTGGVNGYPDVYPISPIATLPIFNYQRYVDIGNDPHSFTIDNNYCSPIIVQQLLVSSNSTIFNGDISPTNNVTTLYGQQGNLNIWGSESSYIDLVPPTGSSVTIEGGAHFDAKCFLPCSDCLNPLSMYQVQADPDPNSSTGADQRGASNGGNSNPPYQKTAEFDTVYTKNAFSCYPNPFRTQTTIDFSLPADEPVTVYITGSNGAMISKLIDNETYTSGGHVINYNGSNLAAGTYLCTLITKDIKKTIRMVKVN